MTCVAPPVWLWLARCLVAALALALVVACVATLAGPTLETQRLTGLPAAKSDPAGRAVLRAWDDERAAAWRTADARRLARLYLPNSVAGRRDVAMLRAWTQRGARGVELTTQVQAVVVEHFGARRVVLEVTDRLHEVRVGPQAVHVDRPTTRTITFVRRGGRWLVSSVRTDAPGVSPRGLGD